MTKGLATHTSTYEVYENYNSVAAQLLTNKQSSANKMHDTYATHPILNDDSTGPILVGSSTKRPRASGSAAINALVLDANGGPIQPQGGARRSSTVRSTRLLDCISSDVRDRWPFLN